MLVALASCNHPVPTACQIDATLYQRDAANPVNPCQSCQPQASSVSWSNLPSGATCGSGGTCMGGICRAGCVIAGVFYPAGASSPTNACLACQPPASSSSWTGVTGVPRSGSCPTGQLCSAGACMPGCWIGGTGFPAGTANPDNACEICQPGSSISSWSGRDQGTPCGAGGVGICAGGRCQIGCEIGGILFPPGATSPADSCRTCQPSRDPTDWSPLTGVPSAGCDGGSVCDQGTCRSGCLITGAFYPPSTPSPENSCRACEPDLSPAVWSDLTTGTPCGSEAVCAGGACLNGCAFQGEIFAPGVHDPKDHCQSCQPAVTTQGLSPFTGVAPGACAGGQVCLGGVCKNGCLLPNGYVPSRTYNPQDVGLCCNPRTSADGWTPAFVAAGTYTASIPWAITVGDFNHDGRPDVALLFDYGGSIGIYLNQGGGVFSSPILLAGGGALAVGDLNQDGYDDLVLSGGGLSVRMNLGADGGFAAAQYYTASSLSQFESPEQVLAIGDLNGDRFPDVAALGQAPDGTVTVSVFLNLGDGGLAPEMLYDGGPPGNPPDPDDASLRMAAFSGGGSLDLLVALGDTPVALNLLRNDGTGRFPSLIPLVVDPDAFSDTFVAGDINGDGIPDLLLDGPAALRVLLGQPDGGFQGIKPYLSSSGGSIQMESADVNGDGFPDVISQGVLFLNQGDGTFLTSKTNFGASGVGYFAVADFDGDGAPDVAMIDGYGPNSAAWTLWLNGCPP
jgi:FG-GAP-like repeat